MERRVSTHLMTPAKDCIVVRAYDSGSDGEIEEIGDAHCDGCDSDTVSAHCPSSAKTFPRVAGTSMTHKFKF
jgi:hypothetical protein